MRRSKADLEQLVAMLADVIERQDATIGAYRQRVEELSALLFGAEPAIDEARRVLDLAGSALQAEQLHREQRTAAATDAVRARGKKHRDRAHELKAARLSAARIGVQMALEDGRADPYDSRTVRRWLEVEKP